MSAGSYDANGIWQYGEDDNPNGTASGLLNLLAASVSTAITAIKARLTTLETAPLSGTMTPTSVAGSGVSLSGAKVVVATATTVSINGCFTTAFDWYDVKYDLTTSGAAALAIKFRVSGTDASTAYDSQANASVNATNFPAQILNATSLVLDAQALTGKHSGTIRVFNPRVAVATTGLATTGASANPMTSTTGVVQSTFFSHRTATAYDGISFIPSTGNVTGTIRITAVS